MTMIDHNTLRAAQMCPGWCDGSDHARFAEEIGKPEAATSHHAGIAETEGWEVYVEKWCGEKPIVKLHGWDGQKMMHADMSTSEARTVAAMLVAAADRVEFNP